MNRKLMLPAAAMSLVLVFTACSKTVVPDETSSATTSEITTQITTEETSAETTEIAKTRRVPLDCKFRSDGTQFPLTAAWSFQSERHEFPLLTA